ncbi:UrcA family protein [Croceibacterium sp. TMG7-5b_MA50]|uniref:UrcA family protein n=1 Tax=Croceibacterium sp. TMG7-5b_MA50 TaxID=3121290 RepID=UPI00322170B8
MFKRSALLIAAGVLSGIAALPAAAKAGSEDASVSVSHADLDLTTEAGQTTLNRRLNSAARQVCAYHGGRSLAMSQEAARCYRQARRDVQVQFAMATSGRTQRGG